MQLHSLPSGWNWTTLGESFKWGSGGTPLRSRSEYYVDGTIPWVIIGDLNDGIVTETQTKITQSGLGSSSAKWVEIGSVLIAMYGSIGKLGIAGKRLTTNQAIAFTKPDPINNKYLFYYLMGERDNLLNLGIGATQQNISQTIIKAYPFPLAPYPEQERIVERIESLFTQLDAGVASLKHSQAALERYEASVLKAAFEGRLVPQDPSDEPADKALECILDKVGKEYNPPQINHYELPEGWCWATIEQLAANEKYSLTIGPFGSDLKVSDYQADGVPLIFVRNIRSKDFRNTHYISRQKSIELNAHEISGGDILITKMGEPPGDACLYPEARPNAIITADCIKWRPSPLNEKRYLVYGLSSLIMQKQIQQITRGVAQKKVSLDRFRKLYFPLAPSIENIEVRYPLCT
jgi:type I restriction enzyme S subunit